METSKQEIEGSHGIGPSATHATIPHGCTAPMLVCIFIIDNSGIETVIEKE
jgi:hypothetical protein